MAALGAAAAVLATVSAGAAQAAVVYSLGPVGTETNQNAGVQSWVGVNAPMTFTFTLADALAANQNVFVNAANVLSWGASAGQAESTISSDAVAYPGEVLTRLHLITNGTGAITGYNVLASATELAIAPITVGPHTGVRTTVRFLFDDLSGGGDSVTFIEQANGQIRGEAICTRGCPTAFTSLIDPPSGPGSVPEPAAWALMILGFAGVGATLRRRRFTAA
jgi:hypothetical protein